MSPGSGMTAPAWRVGGAELRAVTWTPVSGCLTAAVAVAGLDLSVWPRGPGSVLMWLSLGLVGAATALVLDDAMRVVTGAVPTARRLRVAARLGVAALAWLGWCGYAARVGQVLGDRAVVLSATASAVVAGAVVLAAAGASALLHRRGTSEPGAMVGSACVLGMVGVYVVPWPGWLNPFELTEVWTRSVALWAAFGLLGLGCLVRGLADPGGAGLRTRPPARPAARSRPRRRAGHAPPS